MKIWFYLGQLEDMRNLLIVREFEMYLILFILIGLAFSIRSNAESKRCDEVFMSNNPGFGNEKSIDQAKIDSMCFDHKAKSTDLVCVSFYKAAQEEYIAGYKARDKFCDDLRTGQAYGFKPEGSHYKRFGECVNAHTKSRGAGIDQAEAADVYCTSLDPKLKAMSLKYIEEERQRLNKISEKITKGSARAFTIGRGYNKGLLEEIQRSQGKLNSFASCFNAKSCDPEMLKKVQSNYDKAAPLLAPPESLISRHVQKPNHSNESTPKKDPGSNERPATKSVPERLIAARNKLIANSLQMPPQIESAHQLAGVLLATNQRDKILGEAKKDEFKVTELGREINIAEKNKNSLKSLTAPIESTTPLFPKAQPVVRADSSPYLMPNTDLSDRISSGNIIPSNQSSHPIEYQKKTNSTDYPGQQGQKNEPEDSNITRAHMSQKLNSLPPSEKEISTSKRGMRPQKDYSLREKLISQLIDQQEAQTAIEDSNINKQKISDQNEALPLFGSENRGEGGVTNADIIASEGTPRPVESATIRNIEMTPDIFEENLKKLSEQVVFSSKGQSSAEDLFTRVKRKYRNLSSNLL